MSKQLVAYNRRSLGPWLEEKLLQIGDECEIRVMSDTESVVLTGVVALAGGLLGAWLGGRTGAALGAGLGSFAGYHTSAVALREVWPRVKEQLEGLLDLLFNFLRRLDANDCIHAFQILVSCVMERRLLVNQICSFLTDKLGRAAVSHFSQKSLE